MSSKKVIGDWAIEKKMKKGDCVWRRDQWEIDVETLFARKFSSKDPIRVCLFVDHQLDVPNVAKVAPCKNNNNCRNYYRSCGDRVVHF